MHDKNTHKVIMDQLGGWRRVSAMTGATMYINRGNGISFRFKGSRKYNCIRVTLTPLDLYTVEFLKTNRYGEVSKEKSFESVYCDQLIDLFEKQTGLYLSL
jgi:hypothetical protein